MEDQVVGKVRLVPPEHPAHAERRQTELVSGRADRLHPGHAEVPQDVRRAEGREERPARSVHVDVDVEAGVLLQLVERLGELEHGLVRAGIGDAEGGHHHDGVLVDPREHLLDVHLIVPRATWGSHASQCPSSGRTCARPPARARTPCWACRSACRPPGAWPSSATSPPCRPTCRPLTSRWPSSRPALRPRARSTGRPACGRSAAPARPSGGTRPCR